MSTSVLKALPCKLDIKRHSPSIFAITLQASRCQQAFSKRIKRHSPSILYISASLAMSSSVLKALPGKLDIKILYISASLAMSTSVLKALPGKLDIKRHSPSILYLSWHFYVINNNILLFLLRKQQLFQMHSYFNNQ